MYSGLLVLHSLLRWAVLVFGLLAIVRAFAGMSAKRGWTSADDSTSRGFVMALDVQVLVGVILYAVSPLTTAALQNMGGAMGNPAMRYWAVEHVVGMLAGVALAHIGRSRIRKAAELARHRYAAIFFTLAVLAILASIPWPGLANARPLVRGF